MGSIRPTNQLENVLEVVKPDRAILVSEGAEDESVYPVISSRIKIDFVKRVYMKQSRSIEGTYYMVMKTLRDEKMRRKWIAPLSMILIIWGALSFYVKLVQFADTNYEDIDILSQMAWGVIGIALGVYLIGWAYHWAELVQERWMRTRAGVRQGSLTIPFAIFAFLLVLVGAFVGYDVASVYREGLLPGERSWAISVLLFLSGAIWFMVFGMYVYESGKSVTAFLRTGKIKWSFIVMMVSVMATGFIIQGAVDAIEVLLDYGSYDLVLIVAELPTGILIAGFGSAEESIAVAEFVSETLSFEIKSRKESDSDHMIRALGA